MADEKNKNRSSPPVENDTYRVGETATDREEDTERIKASVRQEMKTESHFKAGVTWFYIIAGLTVINSILYAAKINWTFVFGLSLTQFADGFARELGPIASYIAVGFSIFAAIVFVALGIMAGKKKKWAYIAGMVLYALDALLLLGLSVIFGGLDKSFLDILFHGLALYWMFNGYKSLNELEAEKQDEKRMLY